MGNIFERLKLLKYKKWNSVKYNKICDNIIIYNEQRSISEFKF